MQHIESYVVFSEDGTQSFVGPDAAAYYKAKVLISGLGLIKKGIWINRHATPKQLLIMAGKYSGKTYKRGQYDEAIADVSLWASTMALALPMVESKKDTVCLRDF
jgi:hypothetical protein